LEIFNGVFFYHLSFILFSCDCLGFFSHFLFGKMGEWIQTEQEMEE